MLIRFSLLLLVSICASAQQMTSYSIEFPNAKHHEAEVTATFAGIRTPILEIIMSRSSPGRYALAEFAKNIYNIRASDAANHPLATAHPDPYSWHVSGHNGTVVFRYTLFGDHADGTYAGIDETHAHLNLPATFVWARGFTGSPSKFRFIVPPGSNWKTATQLLPEADGTYRAPNLEFMMDSPVELSDHALIKWTAENAEFRLALHHRGTQQEAEQYARRCQAIVLEEEGIMGALPKYDGGTYTFLADFLPYVYGDGMEHRDSTVLSSTMDLYSSLTRLQGVASHEFFHSWNVRRMRPRSLEPFDFERANMSGELWFAEGFTNYYGLLALERAGLMKMEEFTSAMGLPVDAVLTSPGKNVHSAVEMSQMAPFVDAARSVDATNFENTFISYYTYGEALAFGIDLAIRKRYPGKSLDDWMRTVWREHADIEQPYTLADLQRALAEATGDSGFAAQVFEQHIAGKQPMDYSALVEPAGLILRKAHPGAVWLGLVTARGSSASAKPSADGLTIEGEPRAGSPLYEAGLSNGDIILGVDGATGNDLGSAKDAAARHQSEKTLAGSLGGASDTAAVLGESLRTRLEKHRPGDRVPVTVRTRSGEKTLELAMTEDPRLELTTFEAIGKPVTPEIKAFRKSWLSSKALHTLPKIEEPGRTN